MHDSRDVTIIETRCSSYYYSIYNCRQLVCSRPIYTFIGSIHREVYPFCCPWMRTRRTALLIFAWNLVLTKVRESCIPPYTTHPYSVYTAMSPHCKIKVKSFSARDTKIDDTLYYPYCYYNSSCCCDYLFFVGLFATHSSNCYY